MPFLRTILSERFDRLAGHLATKPWYEREEYQYWIDRNPTHLAGGAVERVHLIERLNRGGTNDVFRAEMWVEGNEFRRVAPHPIVVKILKHWAPKGPNRHHRMNMLHAAFQDEIRINNLIRATNIEGVVQSFGGGQAGRIEYLKMEYIHGAPLDRYFRSDITRDELYTRFAKLAYLANTISQLHYYHVVHKDLKPKNLLMCEDTEHRNNHKILVCDFGFANAKLRDSVTEYGGQMTPCYSAPEQALMGENLTESVDYFSFGVLMHEFLTGHNPFPDAMRIFIEDGYRITDRYLEHLRTGRINRFQWKGLDEVHDIIDAMTTFDSMERMQKSPNLFSLAHRLREIVNATGYRDVNTDFLWNQLQEYQGRGTK